MGRPSTAEPVTARFLSYGGRERVGSLRHCTTSKEERGTGRVPTPHSPLVQTGLFTARLVRAVVRDAQFSATAAAAPFLASGRRQQPAKPHYADGRRRCFTVFKRTAKGRP